MQTHLHMQRNRFDLRPTSYYCVWILEGYFSSTGMRPLGEV